MSKRNIEVSNRLANCNAAGFSKPHGLYDPAYEHDSCGTGLIARLDGKPQHGLVKDALKILINLEHRGALAVIKPRVMGRVFY